MKALRYVVDKHVAVESRPGKPEWPNMLTIEMSRKRAMQIIGELAAQCGREDDGEPVRLDQPGELQEWNETGTSWVTAQQERAAILDAIDDDWTDNADSYAAGVKYAIGKVKERGGS
jgi:hypothetical protein